MSDTVLLLLGGLLLLGNAFFVAAEFSLVSVRRSSVEPDALAGSKRAKITLKALENISVLMAGAQLGITLCSLGLGAVAEPALAHLLEKPMHDLGVPDPLLHPIAFAIALSLTVYLHVVIGEMVPKNIALAIPEKSAYILAPMLMAVVRLLGPIVKLLNNTSLFLLRLGGVKPKNEVASTYTRDEMADLVEESRKEGLLGEDNEQILSGALKFDGRNVRNIVIPMQDVVSVNKDFTYSQVEDIATTSGFSRFPVKNNSTGKIIGYVHLKDIVTVDSSDRNKKISSKIIRNIAYTKENQSIRITLKTMQKSGAHIALVGTEKNPIGMVALEDVLEELVGEMNDI